MTDKLKTILDECFTARIIELQRIKHNTSDDFRRLDLQKEIEIVKSIQKLHNSVGLFKLDA